MTFASLILAAGAGTRMGRPKMLLRLPQGTTALTAAVTPHLEAGVHKVVVVLGSRAEETRQGAGLPDDPRLIFVVNPGWEEGMASSLRRGIDACEGESAILVALGDQVGVDAARVRNILEAWSPGCPLVVPVHGERASHPVLFSRELWPELLRLEGDLGARAVVTRHWGEARLVSAEPLWDLDRQEDYESLLRGEQPPACGLPAPGKDEV
jgi:molybdenum cofactor cytidylyltransferase